MQVILRKAAGEDMLAELPCCDQGFGDTGTPVMTLEKWSWFLVQVQNEERP